MKTTLKALLCVCALSVTALLSSCGTPFPLGCIYTNVSLPLAVGDGNIQFNRKGTSRCTTILGWVASGDASIEAAVTQGDIKKVSWATQKVENILGIYGTFTTVVYGIGDTPDTSLAPEVQ